MSLKILVYSQYCIVFFLTVLAYVVATVLYSLNNEHSFAGDLKILDDTIYKGSSTQILLIVYSQFFLILHAVFALFLVIKGFIERRDKYGVNSTISLLWVGSFICCLFGHKTVANYLLQRWEYDSRDGQLGYMQALFLKGSSIKEYVLAFEELQDAYHCCGIYNREDWKSAQAYNEYDPIIELDYTLGVPPPERIHRMGTCNKTYSRGCGNLFMDHVDSRMERYAYYLTWEFCYGSILVVFIGWYLHCASLRRKAEKKFAKMYKRLDVVKEIVIQEDSKTKTKIEKPLLTPAENNYIQHFI